MMKWGIRNTGLVYFLAGLFCLIVYVTISRLPGIHPDNVPGFVLLFFLVVFPYIGLVWLVQRKPIHPSWILLGAVLFRLVLFFSSLLLSDDVYRYIWDGHLINSGVSPYLFAVNDPLLDGFEISERLLVNNNWMASPYLLTAQGYFGLVTKLLPQSVMAFRVSTVILDLFTAAVIYKLLILLNRNPSLVLVYAWHPLIIFEFVLGIHIDFLLVFLMMLSLYYLYKGLHDSNHYLRFMNFSALWFTAAILTKGWPLIFLPILFWLWGWRRSLLVLLAMLAGILIFVTKAGLGLFGVMDGTGVLGAIRIYLQYWQFNGSLVSLLFGFVNLLPNEWIAGIPGDTILQFIRLGLMIVFGGILGWVSLSFQQKIFHNNDPIKIFYATIQAMLIGYGLFLLISSTVHPWYLVLLIPFITILPGKPLQSPWLFFTLTVSLSYLLYYQQDWIWIKWVEYLPVYGLLIWALIRRRFTFEFLA